MERWNKFENVYFSVTERGIEKFRELFFERITSTYVRPSKSRRVYEEFVHVDGYDNFSDFLGIKLPRREGSSYKGYRFCSTKYLGVNGEFRPTLKEAKVSYKEKLKEYKLQNK